MNTDNDSDYSDDESGKIRYVGNKMNFNEENVKLSVESIRVHYFFSEDVDIEKFLNETDIKMRLTHGNDWNCFVSEGSTKQIHHFKNKHTDG